MSEVLYNLELNPLVTEESLVTEELKIVNVEDRSISNEIDKDHLSISHKTIVNLLHITMMVYDYNDKFVFDTPDQTIKEFANKMLCNSVFCDSIQISEFRKNILFKIAECCPSGKICKFISDKTTDLQVGITINSDDKSICVVFRGSESLYDWYYDVHMSHLELNNGIFVHSGFYKQLYDTYMYANIVEEVTSQLAKNPDYKVYITGHSLGAALATLFGYLIADEIKNNITVVSFASPRVGNNKWKKSFESKTNLHHYRVTNQRDVVTALPFYNYKHVGDNIRLFENNVSTHLNYQDESWYDFTLFRCWSISDHNSELYYKNLLKNAW